MATQVQFRGGTTTEHASFNGAAREVTVDTTKQTLVVQDGSTNGGFPLLRQKNPDDAKLHFGGNGTTEDGDLQIYHDSSSGQSVIAESGPSVLKIKGSNVRLSNTGNSADYIQCDDGNAVKLFFDGGVAKFETTAAGATVNGLFITTGNVRINGTPVWAETGGDYGNLSVRGTTASSSGFINLGNGAAAENNEFDLARIKIHNGATEVARITGITGDGNNDSGELWFATQKNGGSLTTALVIDKDGLCGIGTTSPDRMLHLEGGGAFVRLTNSGTNPDNGDIMGMIEIETREQLNPGVAANIRAELMDNTNGACSLFFSAGTPTTIGTKMEIQHNSDVKINSGNLVIGTSGKGIDFSASGGPQGASLGSGENELLDDYEHGFFTPTISGSTTAGNSISYVSQVGTYIKVGTLVNVSLVLMVNGIDNAAGDLKIHGFPFVHKAGTDSTATVQYNSIGSGLPAGREGPAMAILQGGYSTVLQVRVNDSGTDAYSALAVQTLSYMRLSLTYFV